MKLSEDAKIHLSTTHKTNVKSVLDQIKIISKQGKNIEEFQELSPEGNAMLILLLEKYLIMLNKL